MIRQHDAAKNKGDAGEAIACGWLESQGYVRVQAKFMRRVGEIDLIMIAPDNKTIVFIEVRYRSNRRFGGAVMSVDLRKQRKLIRTANSWLQQHAHSMTPARIDVIGISPIAHRSQPDNCLSTPCSANTVQHWEGHELTWVINAVEH